MRVSKGGQSQGQVAYQKRGGYPARIETHRFAMLLRVRRSDIVDPLANTYINAVGENAWFGWPNDPELVKPRGAFADEADATKRKAIAEAMQVRVSESPTHIFAASGSCRQRCARTSAATSNRR